MFESSHPTIVIPVSREGDILLMRGPSGFYQGIVAHLSADLARKYGIQYLGGGMTGAKTEYSYAIVRMPEEGEFLRVESPLECLADINPEHIGRNTHLALEDICMRCREGLLPEYGNMQVQISTVNVFTCAEGSSEDAISA